MRVLNFEDSIMKHMEIRRALEKCGAKTVDYINNQQEGLQKLKETLGTECQYDLIVTDMHYPIEKGMIADTEAGFKLLEKLKEEQIEIPVIICSSLRFQVPEILGTVWYNKSQDIYLDFRNLLQKK